MGKITSAVLGAALLFLGYQAYENAREAPTQAMGRGPAMEAACEGVPHCVVQEGPDRAEADISRRRYHFRTSKGLRVVTCRRSLVLWGAWSCTGERASGF